MHTHKEFTFRLIDVQNCNVVETEFEAVIRPESGCPYVALSYVWGEENNRYLKLTRRSLPELRQPGVLNSKTVPKTIWDAICVVRAMGQQYLWADRLCVPQRDGGSDDDPDTSANIAHMGRIYGEAVFTIVAFNSGGMDSGLGLTKRGQQKISQVMGRVEAGISLFLPENLDLKISQSPWETRAWTYQEKVLSRRMLVFSGGHAVWYCRSAVWREDVNALDGDLAALTFPWLDLQKVQYNDSALSEAQKYGLEEDANDGSVRLYRRSGFLQYVQCVEDLTRRWIGNSATIIDACEGILGVVGSAEVLNSPFLYGLPRRFIDAALLWQPSGAIRRRVPRNADQSTKSLPSWSWAGWEAIENDSRGESKGVAASYSSPFKSMSVDDAGVTMEVLTLGEERMRPWAHVYAINPKLRKLVQIGFYKERWLASRTDTFQDWTAPAYTGVPKLQLASLRDWHLVIRTEMALLNLGDACYRHRTTTKIGGKTYCRQTMKSERPSILSEKESEGTTITHERWILDRETDQPVGLVQCCNDECSQNSSAWAIVLSEAQYLGTETRVDVLGYPLYNVMLVVSLPDDTVERIGLGKIYKTAWRRAGPKETTLVLG